MSHEGGDPNFDFAAWATQDTAAKMAAWNAQYNQSGEEATPPSQPIAQSLYYGGYGYSYGFSYPYGYSYNYGYGYNPYGYYGGYNSFNYYSYNPYSYYGGYYGYNSGYYSGYGGYNPSFVAFQPAAPDCGYYWKRCSEVTNWASRAYYCVAGPAVCSSAGTDPIDICIRQCLIDFDKDYTVPLYGVSDPDGGGAAFTELVGPAACLTACSTPPGFPPLNPFI